MKVITLRKIPREMERAIMTKARQSKTSISGTIMDILRGALGIQDKRREPSNYHDLDSLFGKWSDKEAANFNNALHQQRGVDQELWS